jgi:hypothetical protein
MRDGVVVQFCDSYWEGLSATPEHAAHLDECTNIIAMLVDAVLSIDSRRDFAPDEEMHDERFDAAAQGIMTLLSAAPHVWIVGLLQRAAVDLIVELVEEVAACRDVEPGSVLRELAVSPR